MDGLGRVILKQIRQAPGSAGFDTIVSTYDADGREYSVGVPCSSTAGVPCSSAITTTTYDPLSRPLLVTDGGGGTLSYSYSANDALQSVGPAPTGENVKSRQLEYDGLGRLTSVCEVIGTTNGGGNCAQSSPQTGYWTRYVYDFYNGYNRTTVTQNAQGGPQGRTYLYDLLGRLASETNPESGTTSYLYDSDSTCGTSIGDLVKRVDALGNVTCYAYDSLHRNTSLTYPAGPYASTTPSKTFIYDASAFSCTQWPTANLKGRLAEAFTGSSGSKITDLAYCYTPRGEQSDIYESTPHSAGYYHVPISYWANGLVKTFGPFLSEDQLGYTPDGEGRASGVYDFTHASYWVPSTTYNTASQPLQVGNVAAHTYDPNTLRMTQYSAAANGGGTISGTLTWNPNGSLQMLGIADPFNAADVQTCNYKADDLSRLASVNCMNGSTNVWGQTFSYDPFGNITKNGSISWLPGYNSNTNRYTLAGTSYDANGNVLDDSFDTYTWDADGKPLSTAFSFGQTWTYTNDAFGHMAEMSTNGGYQYSYVTLGNHKLVATGQTAGVSEFPLPDGSIELVTPGGGSSGYETADWLGTIRGAFSYTGGFAQSGAHAPFGEAYGYNGGYPKGFTAGQGSYTQGIGGRWANEQHHLLVPRAPISPQPGALALARPCWLGRGRRRKPTELEPLRLCEEQSGK